MRLSHSTQKAFKILYFCFFKCFFFSCMYHSCCSFNSVHSTLPFPHSPVLPRSRRDNHQIWPNKIKIKLGTNHYIKSTNGRKRFPSTEKRVRDTPTHIPGGSDKNTELHNHKGICGGSSSDPYNVLVCCFSLLRLLSIS